MSPEQFLNGGSFKVVAKNTFAGGDFHLVEQGNQPFQTPLTRIASGDGTDNLEVAKGGIKRIARDVSSVGLQNAGPVGAQIVKEARADGNPFVGGLDAFDASTQLNNDLQEEGARESLVTEAAVTGGVQLASLVGTKLARIAPKLIKATGDSITAKTTGIVEKTKTAINPKINPEQAVSQISQGKPSTIPAVAKTLETIDTKGVKTHAELLSRIDETIPDLARSVDDDLAQDTTVYTLEQLAAKGSTKGGAEVVTDFVSRALDNLAELYVATGDDLARADIEEIIQHAKTNGLTRKEVNDISRVYGQEFGSKAFSKTGDALTGTNAQAFENTRSGLKDVARQGIGGQEAKLADQKLSALYDTRKLVQKNVDAVARLKQRIQERGLVEKAGYFVAKYADILTGGSIRGFVGGILPRGAGYKTMNALDIEEALRKNLDVIEEALAQNTDKGLLDILKTAKPVFKNGGLSKPSR